MIYTLLLCNDVIYTLLLCNDVIYTQFGSSLHLGQEDVWCRTFGGESLAADVTAERPFSSVSAHVNLQRARAREWLVTHLQQSNTMTSHTHKLKVITRRYEVLDLLYKILQQF